MPTLKEKVYDILDYDPNAGTIEIIVTTGLIFLILTNIIAVILQSEPSLKGQYAGFFDAFEIFSIVIFTIEYILRLWSITADPRYRAPLMGRLQFMTTPLVIIDVLSILPFYLPFFIPIDLRVLRILRLFRVVRLFKVGRYSTSFNIFARVFEKKKTDLMITVLVILILLIVSSSLMYSAEYEAQPDKFPSIIGTMWWCLATLTTIGYGDVVPITALGRIFAAVTAVVGIALFGLPAGIFAAGFIEELQAKSQLAVCPHCGEPLDTQKGDKKT